MGSMVPLGLRAGLQERLQVVLEGMPVAVSWADMADGRVLFVNRRHRELFGFGIPDHPTIADFLSGVVVDEDWARFATDAIGEILSGVTRHQVDLPEAEIDVRSADGSIKTVMFSSTAMPDVGWLITTCLDVTDRRAREDLARRLADRDPLTGALNRRAFEAELSVLLSHAEGADTHCVLAMDLDGFKGVNDTFGHLVGDQVLQAVCGRLAACLRSADLVARWGGDEFMALLPNCRHHDVAELSARILRAFNQAMIVDGKPKRVGLSLGWAMYPIDGSTVLELLHVADRRMYDAKARHHAARPSLRRPPLAG